MNPTEKKLITILILLAISITIMKIPIPTATKLLTPFIYFLGWLGLVLFLPHLCFWSDLYHKKAYKEKFPN